MTKRILLCLGKNQFLPFDYKQNYEAAMASQGWSSGNNVFQFASQKILSSPKNQIDIDTLNFTKYNLNKELALYKETYLSFYDLIMGLGESCFVSQELRKANLQNRSFPFDWSGVINWKGEVWPEAGKYRGLERKIELILNDCQNILNIEDLVEFEGDPNLLNHLHRWIRNIRTGLQYIHDFPLDASIEESFQEVYNRYQRRINRMYEHLRNNEEILFVFFSTNLQLENIIEQTKLIQQHFENAKIHWFIALNDETIINEDEVFVATLNKIIILKYREKNNLGELNSLQIQRILSPFILKQQGENL